MGINEREIVAQALEECSLEASKCKNWPPLNYAISLKSGGSRVLTPLCIPDFSELSSGNTKNQEMIDFWVINKEKDAVAECVEIKVFDGECEIYSEADTTAFLSAGTHSWQWDGYGTDGVLDTKILKSPNLKVCLTAVKGRERREAELKLNNKFKEVGWVDARIDRTAQAAEITFRPGFRGGKKDKDDWMKPEPADSPPSDYDLALKDEAHGYDPAFDPTRMGIGYKQKTFDDLVAMAKNGIEKYWTRDGSRIYEGTVINAPISTAKGTYTVKVKAEPNAEPKTASFTLYEVLETEERRATSAPGLKSIYHNIGYWMCASLDGYFDVKTGIEYTQKDYENNAAHEFGHIVMWDYGSNEYSWTHDGTSGEHPIFGRLNQNPKSGEAYKYPSGNSEVNIMHYYNEVPPRPIRWNRAAFSEKDVKGLIWLCRVFFEEKIIK